MSETNTDSGAKFGFDKSNTTNDKQGSNTTSPVEEVKETNLKDEDLDFPYTDTKSVTISLVKNFSLYRKANDKVLPKKKDYIGSSISASRILSSNKEEIEALFPNLIGLAPNNPDFITRIKQYLNNIRIGVDELGKKLDISFVYHHKSDYYKFKAKEDKIEAEFNKVNRQDLQKLKQAVQDKIGQINILESAKHAYGSPVKVEEYIMYRHCLLYKDVAKDIALINNDPSIRFYFKDDQKEADKLRKYRNEVNKAKANYVTTLSDDVLFEAVYTQYLVLNNLPIISGLLENSLDKEVKLDRFSSEEAIKFNKIFTNKDVKLIGNIELLIARGELLRSEFNQNVTSADGQFIGSNIGEVVNWFKSPDNASIVNTYYNKLKNI